MRIAPRSSAAAAAVVLSAGVLAACGGDEEPAADGARPVGTTAAPAPASAAPARPRSASGVLSGTAERLTGGTENLAKYRGDVVLVVNTASQCGFTPQFAELQEVYAERAAKGFTILGFPSDSFDQELDDAEAIAEVCEKNFGVRFPMFAKTSVTGEDAHPLFRRLAEAAGEEPSWNFNKYLLDRRGRVVAKYGSSDVPVQDIDRLLARSAS